MCNTARITWINYNILLLFIQHINVIAPPYVSTYVS